jgi:hypothetical protein
MMATTRILVVLHLGGAGIDDLIGALVAAVAGAVAIYVATRPVSSEPS